MDYVCGGFEMFDLVQQFGMIGWVIGEVFVCDFVCDFVVGV